MPSVLSRAALAVPLLAMVLACRPSVAAAPARIETSAYVVRLGNDTLAVEQFTRVGDRIEGAVAQRVPRTRITRYQMMLTERGAPSFVEASDRLPDGGLVPNAPRSVTVTYGPDTAVTLVQRDTLITIRSAAREVFPYFPNSMVFFQLAVNAARAAVADSIAASILPVGGRVTTAMSATRRGADRYQVRVGPYSYDVRTDSRGVVQSVDGTGTTQQFIALRQPSADVPAVAAAWAQREQATRAMGILSPRDTVRATLGSAELLVDYGRPSARGRKVFDANGVLNDTLWRTGANQATHFRTSVPIVVGGVRVPAGTYTLWTLAVPGRYQLIINKQTGQWGTVYDPAQDLARIPLQVSALPSPVDRFTILVEPAGAAGVLRMRWDTTELSVPITVP